MLLLKVKTFVLLSFFLCSQLGFAQAVLNADGPGDTFELINSVFAPNGGNVVESAECAHPEFGRHIAEVWDEDLKQYVFEFYIHVTPDNDRCIVFDRQRVEIKTYDASPAHLKGVKGETVVYKWRFKIPAGFKPSSSFTHIHQVKAVGGDESDPLYVLTARKGSPHKLELNYYQSSSLNQQKLTQVNLSLFENTWVEVTERIKLDNVNGTYSIVIKKVSDGTTLLSYSNNKMLTIRADNNFVRPKWGIYRSLNTPADLRDESLRFASLSIEEEWPSSIGKNPEIDQTKLKIIPNPACLSAVVNYSIEKAGKYNLDLLGLNGQILKKIMESENKNQGDYKKTVDLSEYESGVYLLRLSAYDYNKTARFHIIKQ